MDEVLRVNDSVIIPASELSFVASRSGGPGGQHVNTTSSRVTVQWNIRDTRVLDDNQRSRVMERLKNRISTEGVLRIHADTERSQHRNRQIALERLAEIIRAALVVPKKRVPTRKTRAVNERRLAEKRKRAQALRTRGPQKLGEDD